LMENKNYQRLSFSKINSITFLANKIMKEMRLCSAKKSKDSILCLVSWRIHHQNQIDFFYSLT
jgi:hypothetical protein